MDRMDEKEGREIRKERGGGGGGNFVNSTKRMKFDYFQKDILVRLESRFPEIGVGERGRH